MNNSSGTTNNNNNNSQFDIVSTAATNNSNQLLTENNLSNYNQLQRTEQGNDNDSLQIHRDATGIIISINQAPEEIAAKTPSLFSNSSANSSIHNSPRSDIDNKSGQYYNNGGDGNSLYRTHNCYLHHQIPTMIIMVVVVVVTMRIIY